MGKKKQLKEVNKNLLYIANAIENLKSKKNKSKLILKNSNAYLWNFSSNSLIEIKDISSIPFKLLKGIDNVGDILLKNTVQFANGFSANNALLWGARGMGKSSLIKSVFNEICTNKKIKKRLVLIEINREDLHSLPILMRLLASMKAQFLIFCDDLSFDKDETSYKSLKTILDGSIEGRAKNVLFYATSNRRHLMAQDMIENERSTAINPSEAIEEKISLSDRFGLWLGFHSCNQDVFLEMVFSYAKYYNLKIDKNKLKAKAIEWSATRGGRSGRVAIQFIRQIAGEEGLSI